MCALVQWVFNKFPCAFTEALTQGSEPLSKSLCLSYGTCWSILKQNKRHLRILISWTKKSPSIAQIYRIFVLIFPWFSLFFLVLFSFFFCLLFVLFQNYIFHNVSQLWRTNKRRQEDASLSLLFRNTGTCLRDREDFIRRISEIHSSDWKTTVDALMKSQPLGLTEEAKIRDYYLLQLRRRYRVTSVILREISKRERKFGPETKINVWKVSSLTRLRSFFGGELEL